jgi:hypothetical protein
MTTQPFVGRPHIIRAINEHAQRGPTRPGRAEERRAMATHLLPHSWPPPHHDRGAVFSPRHSASSPGFRPGERLVRLRWVRPSVAISIIPMACACPTATPMPRPASAPRLAGRAGQRMPPVSPSRTTCRAWLWTLRAKPRSTLMSCPCGRWRSESRRGRMAASGWRACRLHGRAHWSPPGRRLRILVDPQAARRVRNEASRLRGSFHSRRRADPPGTGRGAKPEP